MLTATRMILSIDNDSAFIHYVDYVDEVDMPARFRASGEKLAN